jgi:hypothetical protein
METVMQWVLSALLMAVCVGVLGCEARNAQIRHSVPMDAEWDTRSEAEKQADRKTGRWLTSEEEFHLVVLQSLDHQTGQYVNHCLRNGTNDLKGVPLPLNRAITSRDALLLNVKFKDSRDVTHEYLAFVLPSSASVPARVEFSTSHEGLWLSSGCVLLDGTRPVCDTGRTWAGADGTKFFVLRDGEARDRIALVEKTGSTTKVDITRRVPLQDDAVIETSGQHIEVMLNEDPVPDPVQTSSADPSFALKIAQSNVRHEQAKSACSSIKKP